jgi:hypothetical protein
MVRKLYVNPFEVINKSMPILLLNDIPEVDGADDAYIRRANYISYDRSSLTTIDDNENYFVADNTIDDFIDDPYIIDSYVYLICRKYANSCINRLPRPESVISISKQMSGYNDSNEEYFENNYNILTLITKSINLLPTVRTLYAARGMYSQPSTRGRSHDMHGLQPWIVLQLGRYVRQLG